jgi:hypothetical protein
MAARDSMIYGILKVSQDSRYTQQVKFGPMADIPDHGYRLMTALDQELNDTSCSVSVGTDNKYFHLWFTPQYDLN